MTEFQTRDSLAAKGRRLDIAATTDEEEFYLFENRIWWCKRPDPSATNAQQWTVRVLGHNHLQFDSKTLLTLEQRVQELCSQVGFETPAVAINCIIAMIHRMLVEQLPEPKKG